MHSACSLTIGVLAVGLTFCDNIILFKRKTAYERRISDWSSYVCSSDLVVNIDLAVHIPVDDLGHVSPAPRAAKGAPLPYAAGDELERPGGNFLASFGNTDDDAFTPAAMAAFQRLAHDVRIAGAIETVIRASISRINHRRDHLVEANVLRIDELRHAKLFGHGALGGIDVDANNPVCASQPGTLNDKSEEHPL